MPVYLFSVTFREYSVFLINEPQIRDQGIVVFFAAIVAIASIVIDIINAYIDPRIRY